MTRDPLETLRDRRWDGGAHVHELEERLMLAHARKHLITFTKTKALLVAVALLLFGGFAGAGTAHLFHSFTVEETPLDDGRSHVKVKDADGKTVFDGVLEEDEALFAIDGDEGGIAHVKPVEDEK